MRPDPRYLFSGFGPWFLAALSCLFTTPAALSQSVPDHLATMAVSLFSASQIHFDAADPETSHGWAEFQARTAIRDAGVPRWRKGNLPVWRGQDRLVRALGYDPDADSDAHNALDLESYVKSVWEIGTTAATQQLFADLGRDPLDDTAMTDLVGKLDAALTDGYQDLARSYVIEKPSGPDLRLDWAAERGTFSMQVTEDGDEFQAPFSSSLNGAFIPDFSPTAPDPNADPDAAPENASDNPLGTPFTLAPLPEPLVTLDAQDLEQIRGSIFGEWAGSNGASWLILPMDGVLDETNETARENPRATALTRLNAALAELDELQGGKVYVWVNSETGAREEQDRFRRKKDPWTFEGEDNSGTGTPEQITALKAEIAALTLTAQGNPDVPRAPALTDPADDNQVQTIRVSYTRDDGSLVSFDAARLNGTKITANRILDSINDITGLPQPVINELIAAWQPPEWIDLDATMTPDGQLEISGSLWRLHVTYSGESYEISSIHTPYAIPTTLTRDDRRKAP